MTSIKDVGKHLDLADKDVVNLGYECPVRILGYKPSWLDDLEMVVLTCGGEERYDLSDSSDTVAVKSYQCGWRASKHHALGSVVRLMLAGKRDQGGYAGARQARTE